MMQGAVVVLILSALLCLGSGHHHVGHEDHADNSADSAAASLSAVTSANKGFAFSLYRKLAANNQGKNIFFSPSSVSLALAALSVGARGQTHQQLFSGLGFNSSLLTQADVDQAFHGLLTAASKTSSEDINAGTAVFVDNKFKPQPEFLQALSQSYQADGKSVDFTNPIESAATINKYVGEKTHGKIDQLVGDLDPATVMYLISYIYYKDHADNSADSAAASLSAVTSANKGFAFSLYRKLAANNQGKNIFFSPSSVSLALAALSVGARGQTHQQLFSGLGFNSSLLTQADVDQAFHGLLTAASKTSSEDINAGTAVFVDNKFKPQPEFLQALSQSYQADGKSVDFTNPIESAATINKYVGEKTHGKIDQLVGDLDPATVMYLISYIYYKGKWQTPFEVADTREDVFHVDEQTQVPVQMMNVEADFDVYIDQSISTTVLRLPFNNSYSMLLMLPDAGHLTELEEHICPMHLAKWLKWMKKREYNVYVPKFSIKTKMNLKGVLSQMGITDVFGGSADLTGIGENLEVSEVVHQATLDVDESGATATAATGIGITLYSARIVPQIKFNRPFMVLIADSDNILFMGKILNPNL